MKKYQKYVVLLCSGLFIISVICFYFTFISSVDSDMPINEIRVIPMPTYTVPNVVDITVAIKAIPIIPNYEIVNINSVERYSYLIITYRKMK